MYNGIGLTSTRGTGTSGHVQKNIAALRRTHRRRTTSKNSNHRLREVLVERSGDAQRAHEARRRVEVAVAELEEELTARGYDDDTIATMAQRLREDLLGRGEEEGKGERDRELEKGNRGDEIVQHRNEKLRGVLGVQKEYEEGTGFRNMRPREEPVAADDKAPKENGEKEKAVAPASDAESSSLSESSHEGDPDDVPDVTPVVEKRVEADAEQNADEVVKPSELKIVDDDEGKRQQEVKATTLEPQKDPEPKDSESKDPKPKDTEPKDPESKEPPAPQRPPSLSAPQRSRSPSAPQRSRSPPVPQRSPSPPPPPRQVEYEKWGRSRSLSPDGKDERRESRYRHGPSRHNRDLSPYRRKASPRSRSLRPHDRESSPRRRSRDRSPYDRAGAPHKHRDYSPYDREDSPYDRRRSRYSRSPYRRRYRSRSRRRYGRYDDESSDSSSTSSRSVSPYGHRSSSPYERSVSPYRRRSSPYSRSSLSSHRSSSPYPRKRRYSGYSPSRRVRHRRRSPDRYDYRRRRYQRERYRRYRSSDSDSSSSPPRHRTPPRRSRFSDYPSSRSLTLSPPRNQSRRPIAPSNNHTP